uniref:Uncharacterized protein n=1 Tax=Salix viminalis TaxID=40686 RepID=A0A6N2N2P9_SALVM
MPFSMLAFSSGLRASSAFCSYSVSPWSRNWHCRVDWIADNVYESTRAVISNSLNQGLYNAGIDVEEVIAGHTRLPWNSSRYDNNVYTLQRIG